MREAVRMVHTSWSARCGPPFTSGCTRTCLAAIYVQLRHAGFCSASCPVHETVDCPRVAAVSSENNVCSAGHFEIAKGEIRCFGDSLDDDPLQSECLEDNSVACSSATTEQECHSLSFSPGLSLVCVWDGADKRVVDDPYADNVIRGGRCLSQLEVSADPCRPCPPCVDCDVVPGIPLIKPGYHLSQLDLDANFHLFSDRSVAGGTNVFACPYDRIVKTTLVACNGELFVPRGEGEGSVVSATCGAGQAGPLCNICLPNYWREHPEEPCQACLESDKWGVYSLCFFLYAKDQKLSLQLSNHCILCG